MCRLLHLCFKVNNRVENVVGTDKESRSVAHVHTHVTGFVEANTIVKDTDLSVHRHSWGLNVDTSPFADIVRILPLWRVMAWVGLK